MKNSRIRDLACRSSAGRSFLACLTLTLTASISPAQLTTPVTLTLPSPFQSGLNGGFGERLALEGTDLLVGYCGWLFEDDSLGSFVEVGQLPPTAWQAPDFGFDIAIGGDYAVATSPGFDGTFLARAFIYHRVGDQWTYLQHAGAHSDTTEYGRCAVFHDDKLLVSAPRGGPLLPLSGDGAGRVYVFELTNGIWSPSAAQPFIDPETFPVGGQFGNQMDISGDWLLIGQFGSLTAGASLYRWNGTRFNFHTELGPGGVGRGVGAPTGVGVDVAIDGHIAVVGAFGEDVNGDILAGAAYVFEYNDISMNWMGPVRLTPSDPSPGGLFGGAVDVDAATERIVIGSRRWSAPGLNHVGAAYIFHRDGALDWSLAERLVPTPSGATLQFGADVQINNHIAVIGSRGSGVYAHQPTMNLASALGATTLCHGDGGDGQACTPCPCGNESPPGTEGGCLNASGRSGRLFGERSISASTDDLVFKLAEGTPATFALLGSANNLSSPFGCPAGSGLSPMGGTDGLRCLAGSLRRHGVEPTDGNGAATWSHFVNAAGFQGGQTRHFQVLYRDVTAGPCGQRQNTTNAVSILFLP